MKMPIKVRRAFIMTFVLAVVVIVLAHFLVPAGKGRPDIQTKKPQQSEQHKKQQQSTQQGADTPQFARSDITTRRQGMPPANIEMPNSPSTPPAVNEQSDSEQPNNEAVSDAAMQVHYLRARASAQSGVSSMSKRRFDIPMGWRLSALEVIQKKGRVRAFERNNQVIVEAHALAAGKYSQAFANVKITIEKIPEAQSFD